MKKFNDNSLLSDTLTTHLIDDLTTFGIQTNDYKMFLKKRSERIWEELEERFSKSIIAMPHPYVGMSGFRRELIRESIIYLLSRDGRTIGAIQAPKRQKHAGDRSQQPLYDAPLWHDRTNLIGSVAEMLKIDEKLWGPNRTSNKFQNTIDREIATLRKNKTMTDWNSSKHLGIFRLSKPPGRAPERPRVSIKGAIPTRDQSPVVMDMSSQNLKQKFLSIIAKSNKSNTYKFTLAKSLLDYCLESDPDYGRIHEISYEYLSGRFLRYYWYQEYKYKMKQDFRPNGKPGVIRAINDVFGTNPPGDFGLLDEKEIKKAEKKILNAVFGTVASKTSIVVPAFQEISTGKESEEIRVFYDYDNDKKMIYLKPGAFEFLRKNNAILSKVVLAEWAKFLEKTNPGLPRLVAKIEQESPPREPLLAEYWKAYHLHSPHCFYCRNKLERDYTHVDHFIPWSYIFDNNAWNLVLACRDCNCKKSDSLPRQEFFDMLIGRNRKYSLKIKKLKSSLDQLDSGRGWEPEMENHYTNCNSYGFNMIRLP